MGLHRPRIPSVQRLYHPTRLPTPPSIPYPPPPSKSRNERRKGKKERESKRFPNNETTPKQAFLPYIQATRGAAFGDGSTYLTYRNSLIIAVLGVPGALLGGYLVELPRFGRRGTLALSTAATGAFLYASTTALDSASLLGWNCAYNFTSNVMYAVLYAYTPEVFVTKDRGTGNALTATGNRIFGVMAVSA